MPSKIRRENHARAWKWIYAGSFLAAAVYLSQSMGRGSDGDSSLWYYGHGLKTWETVLRDLFLRPDNPVSAYARWRPFDAFYVKTLWTLGLGISTMEILCWIVNWVAVALFAHAICRVASHVKDIPAQAPWQIATAFWWTSPVLLNATSPFYISTIAEAWASAAILLAVPSTIEKKGLLKWRFAAAAFCAFIAMQSHEKAWPLLIFMGFLCGWIGWHRARRELKLIAGAALVLVIAHLVIIRGFPTAPTVDWTGNAHREPLTGRWIYLNASYLIMTALNALNTPMLTWTGANAHNPDITPQSTPISFLLTVAAAIAIFVKRERGKSKPTRAKTISPNLWIAALVAGGIAHTLPYWTVIGHRFIHYSLTCLGFLCAAACLATHWRTKESAKLFPLPILLLIAANASLAVHVITQYNWIAGNAAYVRRYTTPVLERSLGKPCTIEAPCCITVRSESWGTSIHDLNWNAGAPNPPIYLPAASPSRPCASKIEDAP